MFHFECNRAYLNFHCHHTQSFELRVWSLRSFEYDLSETPSATLPLQRSYEYARSEASSRLVRSQWSFEYSIEASLQEYWRASRPLRVGQSDSIWRKCRVDRLRTNMSGLGGCRNQWGQSMNEAIVVRPSFRARWSSSWSPPTRRGFRQKVDERSFTTQYRVRVVRWHRNHASCRMQVPSKPHICSELQRG